MKSWTIPLAIAFTMLTTACNDNSASNGDNKSTSVEYEELLSRLIALEEKNEQLELQLSTAQASLESAAALGSNHDTRIVLLEEDYEELTLQSGITQAALESLSENSSQFDERLEQLEQLLSCVIFDSANQSFIVENCNLIVRNGVGDTQSQNGSGNIIIGYNEDAFGNKDRGGSHNLVIGAEHQYSAYGGLVIGENHQINNPYASITGGRDNRVSASHATIGGGTNIIVDTVDTWAAGDILSDGNLVSVDTGLLDLYSTGAIEVTSAGDMTIQSNQSLALESANTFNLAGGSMELLGIGNLDIKSFSAVNVEGSSGLNMNTSGLMTLLGSLIQLNHNGSPAARVGDEVVAVSGSGIILTGSATVLIGN